MAGIRYASVGDDSIAYHVLDGAPGRTIVYLAPGTLPFTAIAEDPTGARLLQSLRSMGSVAVFDRRGFGLSDPAPDDSARLCRYWAEDLLAVVGQFDPEEEIVLFAQQYMEFALLALTQHADVFDAAVLYEPTLDWLGDASPMSDTRAVLQQILAGELDLVATFMPSRMSDRTLREWLDDAGARGASPGAARRIYALPASDLLDTLRRDLPRLQVPTLIIRRPASLPECADRGRADALVAAESVEVPGRDWHIHGERVEAVVDAAARFLGEEGLDVQIETALRAVLFTDVVGSTEVARSIGDGEWRRLLDRHDRNVNQAVGAAGGRVVKLTGDGVLAVFPAAAAAVRSYADLTDAVRADGLVLRGGLHVGDVDQRDGDVSGLSVVAASRLEASAPPGVLVGSEAAAQAMLGAPIAAVALEPVELKGLPGSWKRYQLTLVGEAPPPRDVPGPEPTSHFAANVDRRPDRDGHQI